MELIGKFWVVSVDWRFICLYTTFKYMQLDVITYGEIVDRKKGGKESAADTRRQRRRRNLEISFTRSSGLRFHAFLVVAPNFSYIITCLPVCPQENKELSFLFLALRTVSSIL